MPRELKGSKKLGSEIKNTYFFSAVPSSRRSKEHGAAMITALLSGVVQINGRA